MGKVKWAHVQEEPKREEPKPRVVDPREAWLDEASEQARQMLNQECAPKLKTAADLVRAAAVIYIPWELTNESKDPLALATGASVAKLAEWIAESLGDSLHAMLEGNVDAAGIAAIMEYAGRGKDWKAWLEEHPAPAAGDAAKGKKAKRVEI